MPKLDVEFEYLIEGHKSCRFEAAVAETSLAMAEARRHPLNFVSLRSTDNTGRTLRLHLWSKSFNFGQQGLEVHDHAFDIDGFIVQGAMRQTLYEALPDPLGDWAVFDVSYAVTGSKLDARDERRTLRVLREETFREGDRYHLAKGILHRFEPISSTAVTLALTMPHNGTPVSLGRHDLGPKHEADRSIVFDETGRPMTVVSASISKIMAMALGPI